MKVNKLIILGFFYFVPVSYASANSLHGWGQYKFGMTYREAVNASQGSAIPSNNIANKLDDSVKIGKYQVMVGLIFYGNTLRLTSIALDPLPKDVEKGCVTSFNYFLNGLSKKYGKPLISLQKRFGPNTPAAIIKLIGNKTYHVYDWFFSNGYQIELTKNSSCPHVLYMLKDSGLKKDGF